MANFTRGQTFGATEQVTNTKLHALVDSATISSIVNADIDASAAIVDTKLAAISSANKVSGSGLFNLSSIVSTAGMIPGINLQTSLASIQSIQMVNTITEFSTDGTLGGNSDSAVPTEKATLTAITTLGIPSGLISMWSGTIATIPSGWVLCDGTNSTPNLKNRFIVGADADDGGVAKSTVTGSALQTSDGVMPAHTHQLLSRLNDSGNYPKAGGAQNNAGTTYTTESTGTGTKVISVFYALAYIMKT